MISCAQKTPQKQKLSQENKNKLKLNNKDNNVLHTHKLLGVTCFFVRAKSFHKKMNMHEIVRIASFYNTTCEK